MNESNISITNRVQFKKKFIYIIRKILASHITCLYYKIKNIVGLEKLLFCKWKVKEKATVNFLPENSFCTHFKDFAKTWKLVVFGKFFLMK